MTNEVSDSFSAVNVYHRDYRKRFKAWRKIRAFCESLRAVKDLDKGIDNVEWSNILIPFSSSMDAEQYALLKAEAELPGISSQFVKMVIGGLLRKEPAITIEPEAPEIIDWLRESLTLDNLPLTGFLEQCLYEELISTSGWIAINYPAVSETAYEDMSVEDRRKVRPYPIVWTAEEVINWRFAKDVFGKEVLAALYVQGFLEDYTENPHEVEYIRAIWLHEIDENGYYRVRIFREDTDEVKVEYPKANGELLKYLPCWPISGNIKGNEPMLETIIDKEVVLYNKITRRNHVLFTAAAFTPVVFADIREEDFNKIVDSGLGSWLFVPSSQGRIDVLKSPTEALADMDRAIASNIEEIAKLGIRMLTTNKANESGYAKRLQDSPQNATISSLSMKSSSTLSQVLSEIVTWHFKSPYKVTLKLANDFDEYVLGEGWLRLATEWYENGHIPREVWLNLLKKNDVLDSDYDDSNFAKAWANASTTDMSISE